MFDGSITIFHGYISILRRWAHLWGSRNLFFAGPALLILGEPWRENDMGPELVGGFNPFEK